MTLEIGSFGHCQHGGGSDRGPRVRHSAVRKVSGGATNKRLLLLICCGAALSSIAAPAALEIGVAEAQAVDPRSGPSPLTLLDGPSDPLAYYRMKEKVLALSAVRRHSSWVQQGAARGAAAAALRAPGTPIADYHAHISSLVIGEASTPPLQPAVQLPPELAAVIRARENDADPAVAAQIFRQDALLLDTRWPNWVRGREAIELWLSLTTKGLKFRAVEARVDDRFGYIAGYVVYVNDGPEQVVRNFHMSLEKVEGKWLIATEAWPDRVPPLQKAHTAAEYIAELDAAGIKQGVILSSGFIFGSTSDGADYAKVRAENDWVVEQVALYPDRLVAFCGVNPLRSEAVAEVKRCAKLRGVKGIKFHSHNDGIDLRKPEHVASVRRVFEAANATGLHIVAHLATDQSWQDPVAGGEQVKAFISDVLPAATKVTVQIAHVYADTGWNREADGIFEQFATAIRTNAPGARNLYFDLSGGPTGPKASAAGLEALAGRMREVGLDRFLFASDRSGARNPPPKEALNNVRRLPLKPAEFEDIANNRMPYLP